MLYSIYSGTKEDDNDKDSEKSYEPPMEHELDEEVPSFNKTTADPFLRKLCANVPGDRDAASDNEDNNAGYQPVVYPVHDENQEWYKMKPELGVSESFNAAIDEIRKLPLITMLEEIRIYVMERLYNSKKKGEGWDLDICPSIRLKLEKFKLKQRFWQVYASGYEQFEVNNGYDGYAVNLNNRTCGCRAWQLTGIPCVHGVAAISYLHRNHEEYVAECHYPPKKRRLPGRPKMKRRIDESERQDRGHKHSVSKKRAVLKCRICKLPGHNKTTCPQRPTVGASTSGASRKKRKPNKPKKQKDVVEPTVAPDFELDVGPLFGDESEEELDVEPDDPAVLQPAVQVDEEPVVQAVEEPVVQAQEEVMREGRVEEEPVVAAAVGVRRRKPSERIVKLKLAKKVGGEGSNAEKPLDIYKCLFYDGTSFVV
ncbi:hypothetical protein LXL04_003873 [Taraxacum kok-saghyz]